MIYLKNANFDKSDIECVITDEELNTTTDYTYEFNHDFFFADDLEIWTAAGKTGTKLTLDTDFYLSDISEKLSIKTGYNTYGSITLKDDTYHNTTLYLNYTVCADLVDANDINEFRERMDESDKVKFNSNDYIRIDNAAGIAYVDIDGVEDAGKVNHAVLADTATEAINADTVDNLHKADLYSIENVHISTSTPTSEDGNDGDLWFVYDAG